MIDLLGTICISALMVFLLVVIVAWAGDNRKVK